MSTFSAASRSLEHALLGKHLLETRLGCHRAVERFLKGGPALIVEPEDAPVGQYRFGSSKASLQQKLGDILV
jgi:hypothetical protein